MTQRQIAERAGVTQSVVSRVLSRASDAASAETVERVWREIERALDCDCAA